MGLWKAPGGLESGAGLSLFRLSVKDQHKVLPWEQVSRYFDVHLGHV